MSWKILQEAYKVMQSIPRKVNDIIHLNCLDRDKARGEKGRELAVG